jgi:acyl-CoA reductase-like NAD-dependent aldehyde dehydrogenase
MRVFALALSLALAPAQAKAPAALPVGQDCQTYAESHILVRNDVLARLEAADTNLPKAEAALEKAQADIRAMKEAAEELRRQKTVLESHITLLENTLDLQRKVCSGPTIAQEASSLAGAAWEALDAPVALVAGAGMCVGIAWGLNQVSR